MPSIVCSTARLPRSASPITCLENSTVSWVLPRICLIDASISAIDAAVSSAAEDSSATFSWISLEEEEKRRMDATASSTDVSSVVASAAIPSVEADISRTAAVLSWASVDN